MLPFSPLIRKKPKSPPPSRLSVFCSLRMALKGAGIRALIVLGLKRTHVVRGNGLSKMQSVNDHAVACQGLVFFKRTSQAVPACGLIAKRRAGAPTARRVIVMRKAQSRRDEAIAAPGAARPAGITQHQTPCYVHGLSIDSLLRIIHSLQFQPKDTPER